MPHLLPKIIKFNDKLFRDTGCTYVGCKIYKYGDRRILVEPDGSIFHSYTIEENYSREM